MKAVMGLCLILLTILPGCMTTASLQAVAPQIASLEWADSERGEFPAELIWTADKAPVGVIVFSHGAFSDPSKYRALTEPLAREGYVIIAPQHADSESWMGAKPDRSQQIIWRLRDVELSASRLRSIEQVTGQDLEGLPRVAAGHSLGALIAQMLGGARMDDGGAASVSHDYQAVIGYSPPPPIPGLMTQDGWAKVTTPQLVVTGSADVLPPFVTDWRLHLASYEAATQPAFSFVAEGGDHYFGNIIGRTEYETPPQQTGFNRSLDLVKLFLQAQVQGDPAALGALSTTPDLASRNVPQD